MVIGIACGNSASSRKSENETTANDSIGATVAHEVTPHFCCQATVNDSIEEINDWYWYGEDKESKPLKLVRANGKIGFLKDDGEELFPCIFDSVVDVQNYGYKMVNGEYTLTKKGYFTYAYRDNSNCYAKVKQNNKWGLITMDGKLAIPFVYDDIYEFDYTKTARMEGPYIEFWSYETAIVKKNDKWGLINTKGEVVADFIYEEFFIPQVNLFFNDIATAKKDGKWGFLNKQGDPVTPFIYEAVGSSYLDNPEFISTFSEGMAPVKKNEKWGAIDTKGNEKVPFVYDFISNFDTETAIVQQDGKWGCVNKNGEIVIPMLYDDIKWLEGGVRPVKKDRLWGFLNEKDEIVVPMIYDDIFVSESVSVDSELWFFSQDGYCAVKKDGKWGLIDTDNNTIIDFEYDGIKWTSTGLEDWHYFSGEGFLSVQKGRFWSVINKDGVNHIPFEWDDVEIWSKGNVCVKKDDKWGLVDSLGKQLVPIEHKYAMDAGNYYWRANN
jgi:hypothetical protein